MAFLAWNYYRPWIKVVSRILITLNLERLKNQGMPVKYGDLCHPVNVILASPQWQGVCYKSGALLSTFVMAYHCIATFEVMNITWIILWEGYQVPKVKKIPKSTQIMVRSRFQSAELKNSFFLIIIKYHYPFYIYFKILDILPGELFKLKKEEKTKANYYCFLWTIATYQVLW